MATSTMQPNLSTLTPCRLVERPLKVHSQRPRRLRELPDLEQELVRAARELENRAEGFAVYRVAAIPGPRPRFQILHQLSPGDIRTALRRLPGIFVAGTAQQAKALARRTAAQLRGTVTGPEAHGRGLRHYHVVTPDDRRIHIWYGTRVPGGEFYS